MTDDVIDERAIERLLDMIGGDPEDLQELLDEFEETTPEILETMVTAVQTGDLAALRIAAHSLKANAADMGATTLSSLCASLEAAARDGHVDNAEVQVAAIEAELNRARTALSQMTPRNG